MLTKFFDFASVALTLAQFEQLSVYQPWSASSPKPISRNDQARFLRYCHANREGLWSLPLPRARVSTTPAELNDFFRSHGYKEGAFGPMPPGHIGIATVFDRFTTYKQSARTTISIPTQYYRRSYSALAFPVGVPGVEIFSLPITSHLLVNLTSVAGEIVWLLMADQAPADCLDLMEFAKLAMAERQPLPAGQYSSIIAPKLHLRTEVILDWMEGLTNSDLTVHKVVQKVSLEMGCMGEPTGLDLALAYTFDRPFAVWITNPNGLLLAVGFAELDSWIRSGIQRPIL